MSETKSCLSEIIGFAKPIQTNYNGFLMTLTVVARCSPIRAVRFTLSLNRRDPHIRYSIPACLSHVSNRQCPIFLLPSHSQKRQIYGRFDPSTLTSSHVFHSTLFFLFLSLLFFLQKLKDDPKPKIIKRTKLNNKGS